MRWGTAASRGGARQAQRRGASGHRLLQPTGHRLWRQRGSVAASCGAAQMTTTGGQGIGRGEEEEATPVAPSLTTEVASGPPKSRVAWVPQGDRRGTHRGSEAGKDYGAGSAADMCRGWGERRKRWKTIVICGGVEVGRRGKRPNPTSEVVDHARGMTDHPSAC